MRNSWNSATFLVLIGFIAVSVQLIGAQFFDPKINDKEYLDTIQNDVVEEVQESKSELIQEAKTIQVLTKNYIAAKLKQNLFKALRVLAEKELALDVMTMQDRPRQPRQDDGDGDDDGATERPNMLLPSVAGLIKAVFGGNINLTSYVESASQFLPKPISTQIVGVVKLLSNNPGHKYTTTTTQPTTTTSTTTTTPSTTTTTTKTVKEQPKVVTAPPPTVPAPAVPAVQAIREVITEPTEPPTDPPTTEDEEEEEEQKARQLPNIPGLDILGNIGGAIGNILSGGNKNKDNDEVKAKPVNNNKNKTAEAGSEEESSGTSSSANKMSGLDVGNLAKEVRNGLGDLIKVMPDIFRGAHEAYKLLSSVTKLFSRLEVEP